MLRYAVSAALLGIGWFIVLLVPSITRQWLLADIAGNLTCLVVASVVVALLCRRFIESADTTGAHLGRAVVVPYFGCVVYLTLWAAIWWLRHIVTGGLANFHDTLSLYAMGLTAAALSCFVVIPYGLLCQYLMASVRGADDRSSGAGPAA